MKIALLQLDIQWEDKAGNFDRVKSLVERIKDEKVDLLVLPELFSTGYTMNPGPFAEDLDGETPSFLSGLAREHQINVLGSFIEKAEPKPKNSAILFDKNGKELLHYSKIHLPSFLGEPDNYTPGTEISTCELDGQKIGVFICYDLRFPEVFGKIAEDVGCIFVIANWPKERIEYWNESLRVRASDNQSYIVGVNRVGSSPTSPTSDYSGHSVIIDPRGNRVAYTEEDKEDVIIGEIDLSLVREIRERYSFLKDRVRLDSLTYRS